MSDANLTDLTGLLRTANAGDERAQLEAYQKLEPRLFALINSLLREQPAGHSLSVASLANQAYERFLKATLEIEGREKVFGWFCATLRHLIIDRARRRQRRAEKDGLPSDVAEQEEDNATDLRLDLDEAIQRLKQSANQEQREAGLVFELCYYGAHEVALGPGGFEVGVGKGPLPVAEAAKALGLSQATAYRRLKEARALLADRLRDYPLARDQQP
jgi:RNA polymerase sigma factor (sigma-70 family)